MKLRPHLNDNVHDYFLSISSINVASNFIILWGVISLFAFVPPVFFEFAFISIFIAPTSFLVLVFFIFTSIFQVALYFTVILIFMLQFIFIFFSRLTFASLPPSAFLLISAFKAIFIFTFITSLVLIFHFLRLIWKIEGWQFCYRKF